jgi:peptidoglycan/xylan/chitin deacetylase (PgdA/CDA1 family)
LNARAASARPGFEAAATGKLEPVQRGRLYLTFDDGPDREWTPRVLEELERCGARATFFVIGERVRAAPQVLEAVRRAGHGLALHCDRHIRHSELDEAQIEADTSAALATLAELGVRPALWRTPWGTRTPASERVAERHGLELVHWTFDTHDWRGDSAEEMLAAAGAGLAEDAIVLMHDALGPGARRAGCQNTLAMIAPLWALRGQGLRSASREQPNRATAAALP